MIHRDYRVFEIAYRCGLMSMDSWILDHTARLLEQVPRSIDDEALLLCFNLGIKSPHISSEYSILKEEFIVQSTHLFNAFEIFRREVSENCDMQSNERIVTPNEKNLKNQVVTLFYQNLYLHLKFYYFQRLSIIKNELDQVSSYDSDATSGDTPQLGYNTGPNTAASPCIKKEKPMIKRQLLTKEQRGKLKSWFNSHVTYPYPTDEEKLFLSRECGISEKKITTWFTNYRTRFKKKMRKNGFSYEWFDNHQQT